MRTGLPTCVLGITMLVLASVLFVATNPSSTIGGTGNGRWAQKEKPNLRYPGRQSTNGGTASMTCLVLGGLTLWGGMTVLRRNHGGWEG